MADKSGESTEKHDVTGVGKDKQTGTRLTGVRDRQTGMRLMRVRDRQTGMRLTGVKQGAGSRDKVKHNERNITRERDQR